MIRKLLHKILGIDKVITQLNGRVTLIENIVGINSFMANEGNVGNVGNVGSGNVGVGSTVPPDVARYQKARDAAANAGNVVAGNVGGGSTVPTTETQSLCPPNPDSGTSEADGWPRSGGNAGEGNIGIG